MRDWKSIAASLVGVALVIAAISLPVAIAARGETKIAVECVKSGGEWKDTRKGVGETMGCVRR